MPWLLCLLAYSVYGFSGHQGIFSASKIDPVTLPIRIPDYRDAVFARRVLSRGFDIVGSFSEEGDISVLIFS